MKLSITSDYCNSNGLGRDYLRLIAEAGFTHVHWCQNFADDYLYSRSEMTAVKGWLKEYGLRILDIHASHGILKQWWSEEEYVRQAGVDLVANRIRMLREVEGEGCIILHPHMVLRAPDGDKMRAEWNEQAKRRFPQMCRSIEELEPLLRRENVRIALENGPGDTYETHDALMARFSPDILGITYDSGHGNHCNGVNWLKQLDDIDARKDRLYALHLNDNNEYADQHQPPFYGTVDWERMLKIVRSAPQVAKKPLQFEITMRATPFVHTNAPDNPPERAQRAFLADAYARCRRVAEMYEAL